MNTLFTKPTRLSVSILLILWAVLILLAMFTSGCKSRKVNKNKYEISLESNSEGVVKKSDSTSIIASTSKKTVESSKDSSGEYSKKITEYFEPTDKIPRNSPKKTTEEKWKNDKKDLTKLINIDEFTEHSELSNADSTFKNDSDYSKKSYEKEIESKPQTVKNWVGAGLFVGILLLVGYFVFIKKR